MKSIVSERRSLGLPARPKPMWPLGRTHPALLPEENLSIHAGAWFAELPEPLQVAILAVARVRQVAAGTSLARRGDMPASWFGVARGAVRLGTGLSDGRECTLDFLGPSQWFGDIELIDDRPLDLDVVAHVPSTLLVVSKADLRRLVASHPELGNALLQLNCQRLRHMLRRFEELHTLTLAQRLARQVLRLMRQFGRPMAQGLSVDLGLSQADLAAMVGGSRQRVNRALRQMHTQGIVQLGQSRLMVLSEVRLAAVAHGRVVLADREPAAA
jgi:CRP/FNR family transcriptional regulator, cyclic AMP receptor protein